ncbi:hypothetical protein [Halalkalibacter sp. APA_J-10(15)]|uniref:hypothetical protein n=1 Tax=Halalkalibacter sp. APA_J-10(15) TaxID=2933805 RepID=UPI001FF4D34B|nr:hypothetical protein [Halalkalibacter sp. APA_J-10(15)]MCK0471169.1 hypothetical protein [Halalkalibacter sp. APA_J-10(15)]
MKLIYLLGISSLLVLAACSEQSIEEDVDVSGDNQLEDSNNNSNGEGIYRFNNLS